NAEANDHELVDAEVIHQAELVVSIRFPRPVDLDKSNRLAAWRVAQVRCDAAILSLELFNSVERRIAGEEGNGGVQSAAREQHEREAGPDFLIVDANRALFEKLPGSPAAGLLRKSTRHGGGCSHRSACCQ